MSALRRQRDPTHIRTDRPGSNRTLGLIRACRGAAGRGGRGDESGRAGLPNAQWSFGSSELAVAQVVFAAAPSVNVTVPPSCRYDSGSQERRSVDPFSLTL